MGQHWSQRVDMKGEGLILETRVNKEDRGQHSRQGVKMEDKGATLETRVKHWEQRVNIGDKGPKRMTSCQH